MYADKYVLSGCIKNIAFYLCPEYLAAGVFIHFIESEYTVCIHCIEQPTVDVTVLTCLVR